MTTKNPSTNRCPSCGHENNATSHFCVSCGSALGTTSEPATPLASPEPTDIVRLQSEFSRLSARVGAIEVRLGLRAASAPQPQPTRASAPAAPVSAAAQTSSNIGGARKTVGEAEAGRSRGFQPTAPQPRYAPPPSRFSTIDWEAVLGRNWFAIIGGIALALGAAFFLRLAFDNDWIGETGRIILGLVTGLALLATGEYTARRIPRWSQPVTGSGIAILYLSIYAAFGFYQLISPVVALTFLFLVVGTAAVLAIRYESRIIALMGITGAFLAPLLLGSDMSDQRFALLGYILIVDLGILAVSTFYNWRWFIRISMVATYFLFGLWISTIPTNELIVAEWGVSAAFLIFVGATTLFHVIWRRPPTRWDLALAAANAVSFYVLTVVLLWIEYEAWFGLITLLIGVFYSGVGVAVLRRSGAPREVARYAMYIALVFGTLAAALQFTGVWITIAWAIEAAALVWVGFIVRSDRARMFALGVFALVIFRLLVLDSFAQSIHEFELFTNDRFLTFAVAIAAFYAAIIFYRRRAASIADWERQVANSLLVSASLLTIWALTAEVLSFYEHRALGPAIFKTQQTLQRAQISAITVTWIAYAAGLVGIAYARRIPVLRWLAIGLSALVVVKFALFDTFAIGSTRTSDIIGANFYFASAVAVVALLLFAAYMTTQQRSQLLPQERHLYSALIVGAGVIGAWALTAEVFSFYEHRTLGTTILKTQQDLQNAQISAITAALAIYALPLIGIAYSRHIPALRGLGIGLTGLVTAKFILIDTGAISSPQSSILLGANFYFASAIAVSALVSFAAYMTAKHRDQLLPQEEFLFRGLVVLVNLVALWALSVESWRFLTGVENGGAHDLESAKHLTLTVMWTAYSIGLIAIGVFRRSRTLRLAGIGLRLLPIVKLFGFDVFLLVRGYRVAAFVSLGVILLALGLAYQRYSEVLRGFFTAEQGSRLLDPDPKASVSKDEDKEKGELDE
jgi:uncharacterized membrane protein